jgi:hypothetical protein
MIPSTLCAGAFGVSLPVHMPKSVSSQKTLGSATQMIGRISGSVEAQATKIAAMHCHGLPHFLAAFLVAFLAAAFNSLIIE